MSTGSHMPHPHRSSARPARDAAVRCADRHNLVRPPSLPPRPHKPAPAEMVNRPAPRWPRPPGATSDSNYSAQFPRLATSAAPATRYASWSAPRPHAPAAATRPEPARDPLIRERFFKLDVLAVISAITSFIRANCAVVRSSCALGPLDLSSKTLAAEPSSRSFHW